MDTREIAKVELARRREEFEKEIIQAELARRSLEHFTKAAWPIINPGVKLEWNWHITSMCLPGETLIETEDGAVKIRDIVESDWSGSVISFNHNTGRQEPRKVLAKMRRDGKSLFTLKTTGGRKVSATAEHPVFVEGRGYVEIREVHQGDRVRVMRGKEDGPVWKGPEILLPAMLGESEDHAGKALQMWSLFGVGHIAMQEVLPPGGVRQKEEGIVLPVCPMQQGCLEDPIADEGFEEESRCFLRPPMLQPLLSRTKEWNISNREQQAVLSQGVQEGQEVCSGEGRPLLLPLWDGRCREGEAEIKDKSGGPSHRLGQVEQFNRQSRNSVQAVPRIAEAWHRGGSADSEFDTVVEIVSGVSVPDFVYNIEVEGNNNYFANGLLLHNCEHLEAVTAGQIRNLAIAVPPGSTKTVLIGMMWPAWMWANKPSLQFLFTSNAAPLATDTSLKCRQIINSPWYQRHFHQVRLTTDQNVKTWYQTSQMGHRKALSVGGITTGEKGDILVVDDGNDADQVHSQVIRDSVNSWYDRSFHDRLTNLRKGRRVNVAQMTHRNDLINHCIKEHGYELLMIPEEFEPKKRIFTSIGWTDPRKEEGELLRPDRFGPEEVKQFKKSPTYRAKHQQDPTDVENAVYKPQFFERRWRYDGQGRILLDDGQDTYAFDASATMLYASCDANASAKSSADNTAIGVFTIAPRGDLVWLDLACDKVDIPKHEAFLCGCWARWRFDFIVIEAVGANRSMYQFSEKLGLTTIPYQSNQDKLVRAQPAVIKASQGKIWLPENGLVAGFDVPGLLDELTRFTGRPNSGLDDRADVLTMAVHIMPQILTGRIGRVGLPKAIDITKTPRTMGDGYKGSRFGQPKVLRPSDVKKGTGISFSRRDRNR